MGSRGPGLVFEVERLFVDLRSCVVDLWICGFVDLWTKGFVDLWICGFVDLWICGFMVRVGWGGARAQGRGSDKPRCSALSTGKREFYTVAPFYFSFEFLYIRSNRTKRRLTPTSYCID